MKKMDRLLKEWIGPFGIAMIIVAILFWVIWPMQVEGRSMEPTLSDGDFVFVSKLWTQWHAVEAGDLVVAYIEEKGDRKKIVKRVIGVAGDHIVIKEGVISVNAKALVEPYTSSVTDGNIDIYVPADAYFLLGDHREISKDSRAIGCIFHKNIRGKLMFKKSY